MVLTMRWREACEQNDGDGPLCNLDGKTWRTVDLLGARREVAALSARLNRRVVPWPTPAMTLLYGLQDSDGEWIVEPLLEFDDENHLTNPYPYQPVDANSDPEKEFVERIFHMIACDEHSMLDLVQLTEEAYSEARMLAQDVQARGLADGESVDPKRRGASGASCVVCESCEGGGMTYCDGNSVGKDEGAPSEKTGTYRTTRLLGKISDFEACKACKGLGYQGTEVDSAGRIYGPICDCKKCLGKCGNRHLWTVDKKSHSTRTLETRVRNGKWQHLICKKCRTGCDGHGNADWTRRSQIQLGWPYGRE